MYFARRPFKLSAIRYVVGNFPSFKNLNLWQGDNEFFHCSRFKFFVVASGLRQVEKPCSSHPTRRELRPRYA